jgi:hypothetical protein
LKHRIVHFTATAHEQVRRQKAWWLANRDHVEVLGDQLEQALKIIAVLPGAGTPYTQSPVRDVRRFTSEESTRISTTRLTMRV